MEKYSNLDINLLKKLMRMNSVQLYDYIYDELSKHYDEIDTNKDKKDFMFAVGDLPVVTVAHLDTVFEHYGTRGGYDKYGYGGYGLDSYASYGYSYGYNDFPLDELTLDTGLKPIYHDPEHDIMWSPEGLGADDRVGVFLILSLIRNGLRPSVLFTTDEEIGSASGREFANKYKNWFKYLDIKYFMELDRSGYDDCVFYGCQNKAFQKYIEEFGWRTARGTFTDISGICPVLGVTGVNLSVGYYNEHTTTEMIDLLAMSQNYDIIYYMIKESVKLTEPFNYVAKPVETTKTYTYPSENDSYYDSVIIEDEGYKPIAGVCELCDEVVDDIIDDPGLGKLCIECFLDLYKE